MKKIGILALLAILLAAPAWAGTASLTTATSGITGKLLANTMSWAHVTTSNATGAAADCRGFRTLEIHVKGANWGGATLVIEGMSDGTNYLTLTNLATLAAISLTADPTAMIVVLECPAYVRPRLSTGGTAADVTVTMIGRN